MHRSIHCPQCGTPFEIEITKDSRLRTLGCTYRKRTGHGDVTDDEIVAAIERDHPALRGVRFQHTESAAGPMAVRHDTGTVTVVQRPPG